jgi:transketolase
LHIIQKDRKNNTSFFIDAMAIETQSEDTAKRYEAYGFDVVTVKEGDNIARILEAYEHAKKSTSGK